MTIFSASFAAPAIGDAWRSIACISPATAPISLSAAERANFLREGFSWPAFLFGPFWLLARGLWRPLGAWCLGAARRRAWQFPMACLEVRPGPGCILSRRCSLALKARASSAPRWSARGLGFVDVATGPDRPAAERSFFSRWLAERPPPPPTPPPAAAHARSRGAGSCHRPVPGIGRLR